MKTTLRSLRWPLASFMALVVSAEVSAVDWDGNAGGNSLPSFRPTLSGGGSGGGGGSNSGASAPSQPGGYMRNAANEGPETTSETLTEYEDNPANLYWRQGKHALSQGWYAIAIDQFEKAKHLSGDDGQADLDKLLARARAALAAEQAKPSAAAPADLTPEQVKARTSAQLHLGKANAARAQGEKQKAAKSWETAYASFADCLAEIDAALVDAPGDANLMRGRTEVSHEMAKSAYQQGLILEAGLSAPGVTMADGQPLIIPRPVEAMEWLKKAAAAWPEQATIKERYQWHVDHTPVGAAP